MMKGVMGQQISYLTVIVVHSTMHLMHHNHCQIIYLHDPERTAWQCMVAMQSSLGHTTILSSKVQHFIWSFNVIHS